MCIYINNFLCYRMVIEFQDNKNYEIINLLINISAISVQ